ncbi:MAG: DegT/DnrJ/EryC1/StrS aminotransferase family protein [Thermoleophilaceae bacterium]
MVNPASDSSAAQAPDDVADDFVGFARPEIDGDAIAEVLATLRSGWLVAGPRVGAFERLLGDRLGTGDRVRCLSSCSAALFLALRCEEVGPGDEVLLPAITFVGCANAIHQLGATPVLVDVDPSTGLVDLEHAATLVGPRTRALMAVHLGGRPLDPEALTGFRDRFGVAVVEDAAHAIGAAWGERPVGAYGNATAFSFHATKNMTTVEGGALVADSAANAERVRRLACQGISASSWDRHGSRCPADYDVIEPGYKLAMNDVAAALGIHQLRRLDAAIDRRERLRRRYDAALAELPLDLEPDVGPGVRHARHLYSVRVREDAAVSRDDAIVGLRQRGVGATVHFKSLHRLTWLEHLTAATDSDLPAAARWSCTTLSLPLYPSLSDAQQDRVVDAVGELLAP